MTNGSTHQVVILGAGFGGIAAAKVLANQPVVVTLVDQRNYHTFQPLLYEVATAGLEAGDVAYPVRAIVGRAPNIHFRLGTVTGIQRQERVVCFAERGLGHIANSEPCVNDLPFDSLIVSSGAVANFFGIPGAEEFAHPLYTLDDARNLRNHILLCLEEADGQRAHASDGTLNFVIVGGGPTGVESAGAITELLDMAIARDGFRFDRSKARVVLIDGQDHLLAPFLRSARNYAMSTLRNRRVEVRLGEMVSSIGPGSIELADGTVIPTRTAIWAGGVTVLGTVASTFGAVSCRNGRLRVDHSLRVPGAEAIFAIGDAAEMRVSPDSDDVCPQLAQVAIQSGRHAGAQVLALVDGIPTAPFFFDDRGMMATIGRRAAVAQLPRGPILKGTLGWLAWFALHLVYLVGFRNRLVVLVNWTWRYLSWTSGPRVIVGLRGSNFDSNGSLPVRK